MLNLLVRYRIRTNRGGGVISGNFINVYWDDSSSAIVVHKFDDANDSSGTVMTAGPDLGADRFDHEKADGIMRPPPPPERGGTPDPPGTVYGSVYRFCTGDTLNNFSPKSTFPYVTLVQTPNHFSCATGPVCDLQISDEFTIQPATDFVTPTGVIEVTATSSHGPVKYSLNQNFDYSTNQGQLSGLFSGLFPGPYTITVKDAIGCIDQIDLEVPVPDFYNPLYRLDYKDIHGKKSRVEIWERGYEGDIIEVNGGDDDPFIYRSNGEGELNKFKPFVASEGRLTLMSPSNFYFRHLFTQDERKYQIRWFKDFENSIVPFTPAVLPALSSWVNFPNPLISGWDWNTGAIPTVDFGNNSTGFSHGLNTRSDLLYTDYAFESGRLYSFGYNFTGVLSPVGNNPVTHATYKIQIVDASKNVLIEKNVAWVGFPTSAPSIGTYDFTAPEGAVGISIIVLVSSSGSQQSYSIQLFTNLTQPIVGGLAGYELKWLGYVISSNHSEPYIKDPYPVTIVATDGLADLNKYDFLDKDGNKYKEDTITLQAVCEILAKTDLGINIQFAINRFETSMGQLVTDDPFAQCKFSPDTFYHNGNVANCADAISEILKPFGGVIKQRHGKWFIYNPEELVASANFREFTADGVLVGNGSVEDIFDINSSTMADRAVMEGGIQMLEDVPSYGKFFLEHTLLKHESLLASYGFELHDIFVTPEGLVVFKNWNASIGHAPGASYGIKETKTLDGNFTFFYKRGDGGGFPDVVDKDQLSLISKAITIEYSSIDLFELKFSYSVLVSLATRSDGTINRLAANPAWVSIKWKLRIGSYYYNEALGQWSDDEDYSYNNIYVSDFNGEKEFKVVGNFRNVPSVTTEDCQIEFIFSTERTVDFITDDSLIALKAIPTVNKIVGTKVKGLVSYTNAGGTSLRYLYYQLINSDEAEDNTTTESLAEVIRPDDYNGEVVWQLDSSIWLRISRIRGGTAGLYTYDAYDENKVSFNYLDNVVLLHYPNGTQPPENITIQRNNNAGIKVNFEEQYLLNDIDIDNINNAERTYKNFFKKLNGDPTQVWERTYRSGQGKLLELLSDDIVSQYKTGSNKITGSFSIDREVLPTTILNEVHDGNKKYMFMGYELHDKQQTIQFDIVELRDVVTDDGSSSIDAGFSTGFSLGYRS
jgi:hypothetical protein